MRGMRITNIKLLYAFNLLTDFRPFAAFAVIYFQNVTGSYAAAMSVFSIGMLSALAFEIPTGALSDRIGRRWTLCLASAAGACSVALYAAGGTFAWLVAGAIVGGLAQSLMSGTNLAFLYESLKDAGEEDRYAEMTGKTSSMFQVGLGAGAAIGGYLAGLSFATLFWVSVIPQALSLLVVLLMKEPKSYRPTERAGLTHIIHAARLMVGNKRLRRLVFVSAADRALGETLHQFYPAFIALLWPAWAVGIARAASHFFGFVSFWFAGVVIRRLGPLKALITSNAYTSSLGLVAVVWPSILSPALISAGSLLFGVNVVSASTLQQEEFTDRERATMGSLSSFVASGFFAAASLGFGFLADVFDPRYAAITAESLLVVVAVLYVLMMRADRKATVTARS